MTGILECKEIYNTINEMVDKLSTQLNKVESSDLNLTKIENNNSHQIINRLKDDIKKSIKELEDNSDWKRFQIAFFGETNAGKSTLIETLRILFNEPTKREQQIKFKKKLEELGFGNVDKLKDVELKINDVCKQIESIEHKFSDELRKVNQKEKQILDEYELKQDELNKEHIDVLLIKQDEISKLVIEIEDIKNKMSLFKRFFYYFFKFEEQKQLEILENSLEELKVAHENEVVELKIINDNKISSIIVKKENILRKEKEEKYVILNKLNELNLEKQELESLVEDFKKRKNEIREFSDGGIIGDGRSDFTRENSFYEFDINNFPVSLIDVPGIEGDESIVKDEILKAVQKSHAVFYVTNKDAAPNEGTLEKIKDYLDSQTEVWIIYNKSATNPRVLKNKLIKNKDDELSLMELEEKFNEVLGSHYRGLMVVAGLPAFFSQSTCIEPFSDKEEEQSEFLAEYNKGELYRLSQLGLLKENLSSNIVGNVDEKIKASNLNKVRKVIEDSKTELNNLYKIYQHFESDVKKGVELAKIESKGMFDKFLEELKSKSYSLLREYKNSVQEKVYAKINNNIDNDEFKSFLKDKVNSERDVFENRLKQELDGKIDELKNGLDEIKSRLLKRVNRISSDYQFNFGKKENISFNFNMDNGINLAGIVGGVIGAAVLALSNPAGWVIIALSAVGIVINLIKSVWSFFDDDFKKSQQKKSTDENLNKLFNEIKKEINENFKKLSSEIDNQRDEFLNELSLVSKPIKQLNFDLKHAVKSLNLISNKYKELL